MSWSFWLELLVRSAVLLIAGQVLCSMLKLHRASFRHRLLVYVFALLALLPLLSLLCPEIPISLGRSLHRPQPKTLVTIVETSSRTVATPHYPMNWLLSFWAAGVLFACVPPAVGTISIWKLVRRASPFLFRGNTSILISNELSVPITYGLFRPRVLLPSDARAWTSWRLQAVLAHELAHVRRHDLAVQLAAHFITALWWFQPLAWVLRKRLRSESELACDAEVIGSGFRPSEYASELLALTKSAGRGIRIPSSAIAMVRSSDLEDRVRAVLNPPNILLRPPRTYALGLILGSAAIAASAVTITSNEPGGSTMKHTIFSALLVSTGLSAATVSGVIHDSSSGPVADAKVTLLNPDTSARQEGATDANGKFSFTGSGAGQYILRVEKPGFASLFREFDVKGDSKMDGDFTLVATGEKPIAEVPASNAPVNGEPPKIVRVGGGVAQSNLITKVQPLYPAAAKNTRTQGTVELEATISRDGVPLELRVVSSPSDDLSQSSLEAVRQWRYRPTLLNGNPVEIRTSVIVNYTLNN